VQVRTENFMPFISWLRGYKPRFLRPDLLAGLTVAVMTIPQSMAYALIAGLPVQYGLYASIVPTIVGCLWGSSAHLISGPTTTVSLVVFSVLSALAVPNSISYIQLALFLSLLVGLVKMLMGFARLGTLLNFVSHAVLIGYMAGAAVLIACNQLSGLLGLHQGHHSAMFYQNIWDIISHMHQINWITLMLGLLTMGVIISLHKLKPALPGPLIALALAGVIVSLFHLEHHGVAVVGDFPRGLPPLHLPGMEEIKQTFRLAPGAFAIAILGLVEAVSIAKSIRREPTAPEYQPGIRRSGTGQRFRLPVQRLSRQRFVRSLGAQFQRGRQNAAKRNHFRCGGCGDGSSGGPPGGQAPHVGPGRGIDGRFIWDDSQA